MDIKQIYNNLKSQLESISFKTESVKDQENKIRESFTDIYGYVKPKTGEPDISKIKSGIMKKAIEFVKTGKNKLEEDLDLMLDYASKIKNGDISKQDIDLLMVLEEELKEDKKDFNEAKKNFSSELDPIEFQALLLVIQEDIQSQKESSGDKPIKMKSNEELLEKVKQIKQIVKN